MSFMNFTLYPNGGAFMMCESISEFDPNMTTQAEREIEQMEPAEIAQAVQERVPMDVTYDTVIALARDCYEKYIIPLYNMDLVPGATADITQAAESISQAASEVGETIRRLIVQIQMVASYACCDKYIGESLKSIAGILIKNKSNVIRQGYDHFQANRTEHPVFTYNADALVAKCLEFHDLMKDGILTGETICSLGDYDGTKFGRCFSDIIDMLDRLSLELIETHRLVDSLECTTGDLIDLITVSDLDHFKPPKEVGGGARKLTPSYPLLY